MLEIKTELALTPWFFHPSHSEQITASAHAASCQFQIRAATPADLTDVAQIIAESFHPQNGLWGWAFPLLRLGIYEDLRHRLASPAPHHVCLVAVDTNTSDSSTDKSYSLSTANLVGTVEFGVRFSDYWTQVGRSFPYLSNLAIHPKYRRQGAASGLLLACEHLAQSLGFQDLYLHVLENNHQAKELYFKLGYRVHKVESHWNTFLLGGSRQIFLHKHLKAEF